MPPQTENETSVPDRAPSISSIVLRALVYAIAITVLVLFGPSQDHVFVYQGF